MTGNFTMIDDEQGDQTVVLHDIHYRDFNPAADHTPDTNVRGEVHEIWSAGRQVAIWFEGGLFNKSNTYMEW